jgi:hypothetical protein
MTNEMNAFELTDEQLEMVAGGDASNFNFQYNGADATTLNGAAFAKNVSQSGSTVDQSNKSSQTAIDITKITKVFFF